MAATPYRTFPYSSDDHPGGHRPAQLKTRRILRKLRYFPWQAGQLTKAIHVRQAREMQE
jgi:hypothetical protein